MKKRLQKIRMSMTPKQAVLASIADHHQRFESVEEYSRWLSNPRNMTELHQRWNRVSEEIKRATKGQDKAVAQKARRHAMETIAFLLSLHQSVNIRLREEEAQDHFKVTLLALKLQTYLKEYFASHQVMETIGYMSDTPYPLDKETSVMASRLVDNAVHPLHITDYQVSQWLEDEEDAPMAYRQFMGAVKTLIAEGQIQAGQTVSLMTSPLRGFRDVPLIDGEWLDQGLVEMAEWGAILEQKGYQPKQPDGNHLLAMDDYYSPDANWEQDDLPQAVPWLELYTHRETVRSNWDNYSGTIRHIDGHPYIRLDEYKAWKKRYYQGDFEIEEGVLTASWNQWVESSQGEVKLAGIRIEKLDYWFDHTDYVVYDTALDALIQQEKRRTQIENLRRYVINRYEVQPDYDIARHRDGIGCRVLPFDRQAFQEKLQMLKAELSLFLSAQYAMVAAIRLIESQYFDGQPLLFRDAQRFIQNRIEQVEEMVSLFNTCLAESLSRKSKAENKICLDEIKKQGKEHCSQLAKSLILNAKLQTYDQLGYDTQARDLAREMMG